MLNLNIKPIDFEKRIFSVLKLVVIRLTGPVLWHSQDISDGPHQGAVFSAYEPDEVRKGGLDVASISVVDITNDTAEPDISGLDEAGVPNLDQYLRDGVEEHLTNNRMKLVQWMSSHLSQSGDLKRLVTAYTVEDQGKERQFVAIRFKAKGRKVVVIGIFDVSKKKKLAAPIFRILQNLVIIDK